MNIVKKTLLPLVKWNFDDNHGDDGDVDDFGELVVGLCGGDICIQIYLYLLLLPVPIYLNYKIDEYKLRSVLLGTNSSWERKIFPILC